MSILFASQLHIGLHRRSQQDSVLVDPAQGLFAVADGMGGHAYGDEASQLALDVLAGAVAKGHPLDLAARMADRAILKKWQGLNLSKKPGTTLTAVLWREGAPQWVSVGDSRLYTWSAEGLRQVTVDDTMAGASGLPVDPYWQNMLLQALGGNYDGVLDVHAGILPADPGILLLCSDGLTKMVPDPEIAARLGSCEATPESLDRAALSLLEAALAAGGSDNVSIVLVARG